VYDSERDAMIAELQRFRSVCQLVAGGADARAEAQKALAPRGPLLRKRLFTLHVEQKLAVWAWSEEEAKLYLDQCRIEVDEAFVKHVEPTVQVLPDGAFKVAAAPERPFVWGFPFDEDEENAEESCRNFDDAFDLSVEREKAELLKEKAKP